MNVCPQCGHENRANARFCQRCGYQFADAQADTLPGAPANGGGETVSLASTAPPDGDAEAMPPLPFQPLPEGAIVGNGQLQFVPYQLLEEGEERNLYSANDLTGFRPCPACHYQVTPAGEDSCAACGQDLAGVEVAHLPFQLEEHDGPLPAPLRRLAELEAPHPALHLPLAAFSTRIGAGRRHYLVWPEPPQGTYLDKLAGPFELARVLQWGELLAGGLGRLHEQQMALGRVDPRQILVGNGQASWTYFGDSIDQATAAQQQQETRSLARLLFSLAAGQEQDGAAPNLPEPVQQLFRQALAANNGFATGAALAEAIAQARQSVRRPGAIDFRLGRLTDVGVARQLNEDSMLTLELVSNNQSNSRPLGVYVVADGMGGHAAGEIASGLTLEAIARVATADLLVPVAGQGQVPDYQEWAKEAVQAANAAVHQQVRETGQDMGTTVVLALVVGGDAYLAHVGDSRIYRINARGIEQLTTDHSLVERLVATEQITREEARFHPQRNVIYRTIGDRPQVEVDTGRVSLQPGDRLLLCSDGLSGMIDDRQIQRLTLDAASPQAACEALIAAANRAGGSDNITAVLLEVVAL